MKIKLEMNKEQAEVVRKACEFYMRINLGQFKEVVEPFLFKDEITPNDLNECRNLLDRVKKILTGMEPGAFYSVNGDKTPENAKTAYDIYSVIRHFLAWKRQPEGGFGVDFYEPLRCGKNPLPKIEERNE